MKKNYEYKEPEFKVVITSAQDVITASGDVTPGSSLDTTGTDWNTPMIGL